MSKHEGLIFENVEKKLRKGELDNGFKQYKTDFTECFYINQTTKQTYDTLNKNHGINILEMLNVKSTIIALFENGSASMILFSV